MMTMKLHAEQKMKRSIPLEWEIDWKMFDSLIHFNSNNWLPYTVYNGSGNG